MAQAPQPGGYIFLWRSLMFNGHFQMPPNAFKIFVFLLLRVNHSPAKGCGVGEGWIEYEEIRKFCSEKGRGQLSSATISAALDYLEREGYIRRRKQDKRFAQKIKVLNYRKYQPLYAIGELSCSVSKHGEDACGTSDTNDTCLDSKHEEHETKHKQEEEERKKEAMALVEWASWYQQKFVLTPSWKDFTDIEAFKEKGVTDDLIIAVLEEALAMPKIKRPLLWAKRHISDMFPRGVRTAADYRKYKQSLEDTNDAKQAPRTPSPEPKLDDFMRQMREDLWRAEREKHGVQ